MEKASIFCSPNFYRIVFCLILLTFLMTGKTQNPQTEPKKIRFTHFLSLPLLNEEFKKNVSELQNQIIATLDEEEREKLVLNSPDIMHITLSILSLQDAEKKKKAIEIFEKQQEQAKKFLENIKVKVTLGGLDFFNYTDPKTLPKKELPVEKIEIKAKEETKTEGAPAKNVTQYKRTTGVIFLDVVEDDNMHKLRDLANIWLKEYVQQGVILKEDLPQMKVHHNEEKDLYHPEKYHVTLFRFMEGTDLTKVIEKFKDLKFGEAHAKTVDLSVMGTFDETKFYKAEKKHLLGDGN